MATLCCRHDASMGNRHGTFTNYYALKLDALDTAHCNEVITKLAKSRKSLLDLIRKCKENSKYLEHPPSPSPKNSLKREHIIVLNNESAKYPGLPLPAISQSTSVLRFAPSQSRSDRPTSANRLNANKSTHVSRVHPIAHQTLPRHQSMQQTQVSRSRLTHTVSLPTDSTRGDKHNTEKRAKPNEVVVSISKSQNSKLRQKPYETLTEPECEPLVPSSSCCSPVQQQILLAEDNESNVSSLPVLKITPVSPSPPLIQRASALPHVMEATEEPRLLDNSPEPENNTPVQSPTLPSKRLSLKEHTSSTNAPSFDQNIVSKITLSPRNLTKSKAASFSCRGSSSLYYLDSNHPVDSKSQDWFKVFKNKFLSEDNNSKRDFKKSIDSDSEKTVTVTDISPDITLDFSKTSRLTLVSSDNTTSGNSKFSNAKRIFSATLLKRALLHGPAGSDDVTESTPLFLSDISMVASPPSLPHITVAPCSFHDKQRSLNTKDYIVSCDSFVEKRDKEISNRLSLPNIKFTKSVSKVTKRYILRKKKLKPSDCRCSTPLPTFNHGTPKHPYKHPSDLLKISSLSVVRRSDISMRLQPREIIYN